MGVKGGHGGGKGAWGSEGGPGDGYPGDWG
jgi:hypothetical protein